jgi:hypothetical protein
MLQRFFIWIGLAHQEHHHIAASLQAAADDFKALAERKKAEALEHAEVIADRTFRRNAADVASSRADRAAGKLADLFA